MSRKLYNQDEKECVGELATGSGKRRSGRKVRFNVIVSPGKNSH
jgi:hypothetical protein